MPATPKQFLLSGLAALALTGAALLVPSAASAQQAGPSSAQIDAAAAWLAGELSDEGTVTGSFDGEDFTDYGRTLDSALALLAAGSQDEVLGRSLASVEDPAAVAEYTQGAGFDAEDAAYVGGTAKLATVVELTGGDATDVGGVDLLEQLSGLAQPSGRYEDRSTYGSSANLLGHAFALLAFDTAGQAQPAGTVAGLLAAQCSDGGFPVTYEPTGAGVCSSEVDPTGLVLQSLVAVGEGESAAAQRAVTWLRGQQQPDGSFPGEAPVNSTGYALLGLNAAGEPNAAATAWLSGQQNDDGGLGAGAAEGSPSDLYATAQALPGWAGETFPGSARPVARAVAVPTDPTPTDPTPTDPTPTDPTPIDPTPTDPTPTDPTPTDPTPTDPAVPTDPAPTADEPAPSPSSPAPAGGTGGTASGGASSGGALPRTGSDADSLVGLSLALLMGGAALVLAGAQRRRGRHQASR